MKNEKIVNPNLYSKHYFMTDNEGYSEYIRGLDANIHSKFAAALKISNPTQKDVVLDVGCGRGELIYYCARRGAKVLGIDYSKAAVDIANETIKKLSENLRHRAMAEVGDIVGYSFREKYSIIFMIEIAEHMYDWQLMEAFRKIERILDDSGRLIIMTPNYYYEKYLSPIKQVMNIPLNLVKWPLRVLRDKYKLKNGAEALRKIFRVNINRGELGKAMHVNISTRGRLKKLLRNFDTEIRCVDHSKNFVSLLTQKWWGREIIVVAKRRQKTQSP